MATKTYDRLSFTDNAFLLMETPTSPMHVTGTTTFEAESLRTVDGGIAIDKIRDYVASRLILIPRYRERLEYLPIENHPVWVDDEHFDIRYHVRHVALPRPGDDRQLEHLTARVMAQHLDRRKPLWEIWIVEGLANPAHFIMISKIHHCMVDGASSVALLHALLKPEATDADVPPPQWKPRLVPTSWELVKDTVGRFAQLPIDIASSVPRSLQQARDVSSVMRSGLDVLRGAFGGGMSSGSETSLNQRIGPHRRLERLTMDIDDVKSVKNRLGGTLNDVVLATVAGALRRFLKRRGTDVSLLDFRVLAPVSVRTEQERDSLGNRISAWVVPMPLGESEPQRRFDAIRAETMRLKRSDPSLGAALMTQVGEWTPSTLLSLGARIAPNVLPFNLVVTNVPGPQQPLYMLGARMVDNFGFIPLLDSLCLGVVLFSYAGRLCWGFTAERDLVPDLSDFVADIEVSFRELRDAPRPREISPPLRRAGRKRQAGPKAVKGRAGPKAVKRRARPARVSPRRPREAAGAGE